MSWFKPRPPQNRGIYLGRVEENAQLAGEARYGGGKHLITIGPNGSGKGTGIIVPNLADLRRSILIIDPKGEAAAITARKRAKFGRVVILNPFNVLADKRPWLRSNGFNPLGVLNPKSPSFPDDATGIAEALVRIEGSDPHWSTSAQELVAALVMWERMTGGPKATLGGVRRRLTEPALTDDNGVPISGLAKTAVEMATCGYPPVEAKAGRFTRGTKEIESIVSTATTHTRFLDSPAIYDDLAGGGFDFAAMKREVVTVYLVLPANRLETHSGWLRLMVVSALRALLESPPSRTLPPVLFMLDEFAQLGYLPSIENAMGIARGFGVQLWPFLQDLNQLRALYKDRWETFIGARGALTAFAPQDWFTADYLSKLCGQQTKIVESRSENLNAQGASAGQSWGPQGFPLFRPEELMRLTPQHVLCFVEPAEYPFFTRAPGYWDTPFNAGLDRNPYFDSRAA